MIPDDDMLANTQDTMPRIPLVPRNHRLKAWPHWFEEIAQGRKTFDIRSTKDRIFQAGDTIEFFSWNPKFIDQRPPAHEAPGSGLFVHVIGVYHDLPGLEPGHCVLSIELPRDFVRHRD